MVATAEKKGRFVRHNPENTIEVARASGNTITDQQGRSFLDLYMGWGVGNLGWEPAPVLERMRRYQGPHYVPPRLHHAAWDELSHALARIAPGDLSVCYRATGGTEAVEIALQLAGAATGRRIFASVEDSYHGNSIATRSIASSRERRRLENPLSRCEVVEPPLDADALDDVEDLLRRNDVAAFVIDPLQCNAGLRVPTRRFMEGLERLCERYGTLLVFDEVASGFGRTGSWFAADHFGVEPDILCLGKGITAGCAPMGATVVTPEVADDASDIDFYSSYGWHPLAVEAALGHLSFLESEGAGLLRNVAERRQQFESRLDAISFPSGARLEGEGLAVGVRFEESDYVDDLVKRCEEAGLLVTKGGDSLVLFPALNIDAATVDRAMDILASCVAGPREESASKAPRREKRTREPRVRATRTKAENNASEETATVSETA